MSYGHSDFRLLVASSAYRRYVPSVMNPGRGTLQLEAENIGGLGMVCAAVVVNEVHPAFRYRKYPCIFNHFYVIRPESHRIWWHYAEVTAIKVIQGHRVWYQSKAHMQLSVSD